MSLLLTTHLRFPPRERTGGPAPVAAKSKEEEDRESLAAACIAVLVLILLLLPGFLALVACAGFPLLGSSLLLGYSLVEAACVLGLGGAHHVFEREVWPGIERQRAARAVRRCYRSHRRALADELPPAVLESRLAERILASASVPQAWAAARELLEALGRSAQRGGRRARLEALIRDEERAIERFRSVTDLDEELLESEITKRQQKIRDLKQQLELLDAAG